MELACDGHRVSLWEDEMALETGHGDDGTAMWTSLMPLNRAPKNGASGHFCVYFTTIKKSKSAGLAYILHNCCFFFHCLSSTHLASAWCSFCSSPRAHLLHPYMVLFLPRGLLWLKVSWKKNKSDTPLTLCCSWILTEMLNCSLLWIFNLLKSI